MTHPEQNAGIAQLKKVLLTFGWFFLALTLFSIVFKGCVSGCSLGKKEGIVRSYKQGFPLRLTKGRPSAVYKMMKKNTMYGIYANKPFYAMDADEDLYEKGAGCAIWISGPEPGWLVVQARHDGTVITKIEEGSCKEFKK